jgi:hypothetical protein
MARGKKKEPFLGAVLGLPELERAVCLAGGGRGGDRNGGVKGDRAGRQGRRTGCCVEGRGRGKARPLLPASFLHRLYWDLQQWVRLEEGAAAEAALLRTCPDPREDGTGQRRRGPTDQGECLLHQRPPQTCRFSHRHLAV